MAIAFNKMVNDVIKHEGLASSSSKNDVDFDSRIDFWFNVKLFFFKRLPSCMHCCLHGDEKDSKRKKSAGPTFRQMVTHFDELLA